MTRLEREELCELSLQAFGTRYGWKRAVEKGFWDSGKDDDGNPVNLYLQVEITHIKDFMIKKIAKNQKILDAILAEKLKTDNTELNVVNEVKDGEEEVSRHSNEV